MSPVSCSFVYVSVCDNIDGLVQKRPPAQLLWSYTFLALTHWYMMNHGYHHMIVVIICLYIRNPVELWELIYVLCRSCIVRRERKFLLLLLDVEFKTVVAKDANLLLMILRDNFKRNVPEKRFFFNILEYHFRADSRFAPSQWETASWCLSLDGFKPRISPVVVWQYSAGHLNPFVSQSINQSISQPMDWYDFVM